MTKRRIRYRIPTRSLVTQSALIGDPRRSTTTATSSAISAVPKSTSAIARIIAYANHKSRTISPKEAARALRLVRLLMQNGYSYKGAMKALFGEPLFYALSPPDSMYADFSPLTLQVSNSHTLEAPFGAAIYTTQHRNPGAMSALRSLINNVPSTFARQLLSALPIV